MNEDLDTKQTKIIRLPPDRWPEYRALRLRALKEEPQAFGSKYEDQVAYPAEKWQMRLEEASRRISSWMVFAGDQGKLVGMIAGFQSSEDQNLNIANIVSVFVAPEARGKGISRKLIEGIINEITTNSRVTKLKLSVNKDQIPALKLYESFGFVKVGEENNEMGDGKIYTEYLMEKII